MISETPHFKSLHNWLIVLVETLLPFIVGIKNKLDYVRVFEYDFDIINFL